MEKKTTNITITISAVILAYFLCCLPHEWAHGLMAWIFKYKTSPFNIHYGGVLLLHCDENVPYDKILASGLGYQAALIGIAGITYNGLMLLLALVCLKKNTVRHNEVFHRFFYWLAVFNLCPILGYIPNGTFSTEGDVGRFVTGLTLSPWLIFIPGTLIVTYLTYDILYKKLDTLFQDLKIIRPATQRLYLWFTIFVLFFLIYTHGYNPFSDPGALRLSKAVAAATDIIALILLYILDPQRGPLTPYAKRV